MSGLCGSTSQRIAVTDPAGTWGYDNIVGSKVKVKSMSLWNGLFSAIDGSTVYTVSAVKFRISLDGNCFTIVELSELPDRIFTLKDLEFVTIYCNE